MRPSLLDERGQRVSALTLNVAAAAAERASSILRWLLARRDDVIVLTETSLGPGTELLVRGLADHGYLIASTAAVGDRGAVIASQLPIRRRLCSKLEVTLPWRVAAIELDGAHPLAFLGVYVPSRDRTPEKIARKEGFIYSLMASIEALPRRVRQHLIIAGDYNVVSRSHVPARSGYFAYEYGMLESLERLGFVGGHELSSGGRQPHSWIGRSGSGYLYDYFHVARAIEPFVASCDYVHETRSLRLSDHAAVSLVFALSAAPTPA